MTQILELLLPSTPDAPAAAREAIDELSSLNATPQVAFDVRLLVSELVTNSVRHASLTPSQTVRLVIALSPQRVRCEIHDPGPGFSVHDPRPRPNGDGGWGLHLVKRLTDRWAVERNPGTHVWFEIDLTRG